MKTGRINSIQANDRGRSLNGNFKGLKLGSSDGLRQPDYLLRQITMVGSTRDSRLCVPASQQVCLYRAIISFQRTGPNNFGK
jgi:hypothetical protein